MKINIGKVRKLRWGSGGTWKTGQLDSQKERLLVLLATALPLALRSRSTPTSLE